MSGGSAESLDHSGLFDGLRRMVKTTRVAGSVGVRMAGRRLGRTGGEEDSARSLKLALGSLRGPLVKVAQILASIPGLLPEDYARELAELQSHAPAMGWGFVRRRMRAELGDDWETRFASFEREPVNAASLGQVHRALMPDGASVACKLQYPAMQGVIENDLAQLKLLFGIYGVFGNTIRQDEVYKELSAQLREEIDYCLEARNLALYAAALKKVPEVVVPRRVFHTERLIVMEWLEGRSLKAFLAANPSQEARNQVARILFKAWYVPFYAFGILHGDPHLGNFTIRQDGRINLLDFGSIRIFDPKVVRGVAGLREALRAGDEKAARKAYEAWGFRALSPDLVRALNDWARFFFRSLMVDEVVDMAGTHNVTRAKGTLENVFAQLKKCGGVTLPREFVLLDRSAIGLGSAFLWLDARLNWSALLDEILAEYPLAGLEERRRQLFAELELAVEERI